VTAYKSLLKEKEALDAVLNTKKTSSTEDNNGENGNRSDSEEKKHDNDPNEILLNSLKTLNAEKSQMEKSFLADKKNLRQELSMKDKELREVHEKIKQLEREKQELKTKLISYDRMFSDERHLKENLETQLNQLKTQFSQTSNSDKIINTLNKELTELRNRVKLYENNKMKDESDVLSALKSEMENLKQQHISNLMFEKQRANEANERSKKLTALHEERVQNLESRLAELSHSVAHYHQLRESDEKSIVLLKDKISQLTKSPDEDSDDNNDNNYGGFEKSSRYKLTNVNQIIDEIQRLKQMLIYENSKLSNPMDISHILSHSNDSDDSSVSYEKYTMVKNEREVLKAENDVYKNQMSELMENLRTLKEKIVVLNKNIEDYETEIESKTTIYQNDLKAERSKSRDALSSIESDYRSKMSQLEQQLQKQRERSLMLLEEKENEIRTLKTSYELFIPKKSSSDGNNDDDAQSSGSGNRKTSTSTQHLGIILNQQNATSSNIPETYMLFYSNELARKDMELASVRKAKNESDELIRQTLKEKIMIQEELDEKIANLEQQVHYLNKMKSREGANLEYLKNVTISYLTTSDLQAKRKMLNAIAAVLKFDDPEMKLVNNYCGKKK
jgi:hypothetical protein